MATIFDLVLKPLLQLPPEEGLQLILDIRERRRVRAKDVAAKAPALPKSAAVMLAGMSDNELEQLMQALQERRQ